MRFHGRGEAQPTAALSLANEAGDQIASRSLAGEVGGQISPLPLEGGVGGGPVTSPSSSKLSGSRKEPHSTWLVGFPVGGTT